MINVHIVVIMNVVWVRIVQKLLETEMKIMVIQGAGTTRGEILTLNRGESLGVNHKTAKTATIPDTTVVVVKRRRMERYGKKGESKIKSNLD